MVDLPPPDAAPTVLSPAEVLSLLQSGDLLDHVAHRLSTQPVSHLVATVADLHNQGQSSLPDLLSTPKYQVLDRRRFYAVHQFLSDVLPLIQMDVGPMLDFVANLEAPQEGERGYHGHQAALASWLKADLARAQEVIRTARTGDEKAIGTLASALIAVGDLAVSQDIATTYPGDRRLQALFALAQLPHPSPNDRSGTVSVLAGLLDPATDDPVRAQMLRTLDGVFEREKVPLTPEARSVVKAALDHAGGQTLSQAAYLLWHGPPVVDRSLVDLVLPALTALTPDNQRGLSSLNMALSSLLQNGFAAEAVDFMVDLFAAHEDAISLDIFDIFMPELMQQEAALNRAIVVWLLSDDHALAHGLASELLQLGKLSQTRTIDLALFDLSPERRQSLCFRVLGYLFLAPVVAGSVLLSVWRSAKTPLAKAIEELLFDPLLTNFGGELVEYLKSIPVTDKARPAVKRALKRKDTYLKGLRAVGSIKELAPPARHLQAEREKQQDEMRRAHDAAQQRSPLLNAVHRSTILHGRAWVSHHYGMNGQPTLTEGQMQTFSASFEAPRAAHFDSFGLDELILILKTQQIAP